MVCGTIYRGSIPLFRPKLPEDRGSNPRRIHSDGVVQRVGRPALKGCSMDESTEDDVIAVIRQQCKAASMRKVAEALGVTPAYISDILKKRRAVSEMIAEKFGFERVIETRVYFRKKKV
jgi:hypothetical protein